MRALKFAAVFAVVAGVFCGTPNPEQPGSETDLTEQGKPVGYGPLPAAAFEVLTQVEVDALVKVLPGVTAALKAADYEPEYKEDGGIADMIASSVTGMRTVPGVEEAMKKADMSWEVFQTTMLKVMSATAAISLDMAFAMAESSGGEGEEAERMKAEIEKGKEFCARVPEANKKMVMENRDALGALGGGR
jgi:hypothetical protein